MVKKKTISKKLDKHFKNERKLAITLATAIVVAVLLIGTAFIYYEVTTTSTKNQTIATSDKPAADYLKDKAFEAFTNKKFTQSRALYLTAEKQYEYIVENSTEQIIRDTARNDAEDCKNMLFQIGMQVDQ